MSSGKRYSINDIKLPPSLVTKLSPEVLKELSKQDDATFYQFFEGLNLEDVKKIRQKYEQIRDANNDLALKNVENEPRFSQLKLELVEKASELSALKEEHDKMYTELKVIQSKSNPQAVQKELSEATKAIERESEVRVWTRYAWYIMETVFLPVQDFASDFVSGKLSVSPEEFQEKFLEQRRLYWLRKVKTEKMKELLLNYRPTPTPRTKSSSETSSNAQPPYPTPLQSLPAQHTHSSKGYTDPAVSLPPYPPRSAMPVPSQPFPAAAYAPYQSVPPSRPPAYAGPGPNRHNQHRY